MEIIRISNVLFLSNTWLIILRGENSCFLVDCGDLEPLLPLIKGKDLKGVLLTHGHFDHIYGLNELCAAYPEAKVYCSSWTKRQLLDEKLNISYYHEMPFVFAYPERLVLVDNKDQIDLGNGIRITAVFTPGHHPGCITWMTDDALFTGDAYIPGVKVVTKLPFGDRKQAVLSQAVIQSLATSRTIYPGHFVEPMENTDSFF